MNRWSRTALVALGWCALATRGAAEELRSPALAATFDRCTLTSLSSRLTGETLARRSRSAAASLQRLNAPDLTVPAAGRASRGSEGRQSFAWRSGAGGGRASVSARCTAEPISGDLIFSLEGGIPGGGLRAVNWVLDEVPDSVAVLVPGNSGQRFDAASPLGRRVFDYPIGWECQFVLLQGKAGGVLIYAEDRGFRYKDLIVEHLSGRFRLTFATHPDAPYERRDRVEPLTWRLHAYRGPWQAGVRAYQAWAKQRFPSAFAPIAQPSWVHDIRFVALVGNDPSILPRLAAAVDPRQTLLYTPGWRKYGYDRMYPDYEAAPEFPAFLAEAHRLGFRVMVHVNYFGCDPKHPLYATFRDHQMRDPLSGDLLWWDWAPADPPIRFAYINPAYAPWRRLFVEKMVEVSRKYGVDALHLDQTLCMYNDRNGPIDGVNSMEGNLRLHQELRRALPGVALSGEGLDEITCRYEAFAQRHVYGLDHTTGKWTDALLKMAHPVSSMALLPRTTLYGYLGMANPQSAPGTYCAWRRAYERFGVVPTFAWPDAAQIGGDDPLVQGLLAEARLWTTAQPKPDFDTPWRPNELFVYRTADGRRLAYVRDQGVALRLENGSGRTTTIEWRIEGVREAKAPGSLPGWPVYDAQRILGLDPAASYAWSPKPRDLRSIHIESLPPGVCLTRTGIHAHMARFAFEAEPPDRRPDTIALWRFRGPARSGVRLKDGRERTYRGIGFLDDATNANAEVMGEGLFIHPPWRGKDLPGVSFVEFPVRIPAGGHVRFACGVHLNTGAEGRSDGALFAVTVACGTRTLHAERFWDRSAIAPLELDLAELAGKAATVRLSVGPGPKGDPSFDWALFEKPMIYAESVPGAVHIRLAGLGPGDRLLDDAGDLHGSQGGVASLRVSIPGQILVMRTPPTAVQAPVDLLATPYAVHSAGEFGLETGQPIYPTAIGEATVCGVSRRSLHEHPPNQGRTFVDYWLRLPPNPLSLVTEVGIRDGSQSTGVAFAVEVNGRQVFRHEALPGQPWTPVRIDLGRYAGRAVLLTLVTDSMGPFNFDWAVWASPRLEVR